jgi:hypothetical protein
VKLGRTQTELVDREKAKEGVWMKFALFPKWCCNTDRWVWLESYRKEGHYNANHQTTFFYNYETTK